MVTGTSPAQPTFLDRGSERILRACVTAIRPRGAGLDQPIDDEVVLGIDRYLSSLPPLLRVGLPLGMRLLEYGPPVFAKPRRWTTFSRLPRDEQLGYFADWLHAGGLRGNLALGLRTVIFLVFYQHPAVLESLGVDWEGRARDLVRERATLLAQRAEPGLAAGPGAADA